tara:strand:+ start:5 stop:493 length:489 start_codon:yes stop_codon:yes gene_type:complete
MIKIIVTGPESSGKTTICRALSHNFKLPYSKEYAREYLSTLNKEYDEQDLLKIAKSQLKNEYDVKLLDTDLITIKIWSMYRYGVCNKWIIDNINMQKDENRFYLLCKPDIPWINDEQRENPNDRDKLFEIYKNELCSLGHKYFIIDKENRIEKAIQKIVALI